jgi:2-phosphosulfolactate phosphatase
VKRTIEVVLTPALLPLYEVKGKTVVIIDILRASTSICVALARGVNKIIPVSTPAECKVFKEFDFLCAAERNALKVDGFDLGNSPFEYDNPLLNGRNIAFTTTNGTKAIKLAREMQASTVLVGSFLNMQAICSKLLSGTNSVILLCAGWKDKVNLEDTLFAGALVHYLNADIVADGCDSSLMAEMLFRNAETNLEQTVRRSSHAQRFSSLDKHGDDVKYCLRMNTLTVVPYMEGEFIIANH